MVLGKADLLRHIEAGEIIVDPLDKRNIKGASIDVSLGQYYFRMQAALTYQSRRHAYRNIYAPDAGRSLWGKYLKAETLRESIQRMEVEEKSTLAFFEGIHPDEKVIMMHPDETILAHTHEFVGSTKRFVGVITTRSTPGRQAVEIKPVLWGDPGFIGRWTLVVNNPTPFITPIVVGRRLPQIFFLEVKGETEDYGIEAEGGKYQVAATLEELKRKWNPDDILPKMHKDREVDRAKDLFFVHNGF
ncbi:MAG TPA: hypothetical protein VJH55_01420 [Candidatus Paceibacterota bacterium]